DDKAPAVWRLKQPKPLAGQRADAANVDAILGTLLTLHPNEWVAEKPSEKELETFGLKTPQLTATLTDDKKEERTYLFGQTAKDNSGVYAKLNRKGDDRNLVFLVRPDVLKALQREL